MISIDTITEAYLKKLAASDALGPPLGDHGDDENDEYRRLLRRAIKRLALVLFVLYFAVAAIVIGGPIMLWWVTMHGPRSPYDGLLLSPSLILLWKLIRLNEQLRLAKENKLLMSMAISPKERRGYLDVGVKLRQRQHETATATISANGPPKEPGKSRSKKGTGGRGS
jgi:hypothetical protein